MTSPGIQQVRVPGRIYEQRNYYGQTGYQHPPGTTYFTVTDANGTVHMMVREPDRWETRYNGTITQSYSNTINQHAFDHQVALNHVVGTDASDTLVLNPTDEYGNQGTIDFRGSISAGGGDDVIDLSAAQANSQDWWAMSSDYGYSSPSAVDIGYGAFVDGGDGNDLIIGTEGMDFLVGGAGNDTLKGGMGADTYWIGRNAGDADVIDDEGSVSSSLLDEANAYGGVFPSDVLEFGPGIALSDLSYALIERPDKQGTILRIFINDSQHVDVTYDMLTQSAPGQVGIELYHFDSGQTLTLAQLLSAIQPSTQHYGPVVNWGANFDDYQWAVQDDEFSMSIPNDLFMQAGTNEVKLAVTLGDGSPLPAWLQFDSQTGTLSGQVPHGAAYYDFRVVATDSVGDQSIRNFSLNVAGDRISTEYNADGSWQTTVQDMSGNQTTTFYAADGTRLRDEWSKTNGTNGTDTFSADGSSVHTSDSGWTGHMVVSDDGHGNITHTYQTTWSYQNLVGSGVNDTFIVDHFGATIQEPVGGSNAVLQTSINFTVPDNVNQIVLTGNGWQNVVGNNADDRFSVTGMAGSSAQLQLGDGRNTVNAQNSNVSILMGAGDNIFSLGDGDNVITINQMQHGPNAGNGNNSVHVGNGNNTVKLGDGNNLIDVGGGSNTITVGVGTNDIRIGQGADVIQTGSGVNTIHLNTGQATVINHGGQDTVYFASMVQDDQLWFAQDGNDLLVTVDGTSSNLRLTDWFNGATHATLVAGDGHQLIDSQVNSLVQAMAQFSPPPVGQMTLSQSQQDNLMPVIAASWR